jgi:hypothetical protein
MSAANMRALARHSALLVVVSFSVPAVVEAQARDTTPARVRSAGSPATPCCAVVKVDAEETIVTARETATGFTFRFVVKDSRLRASLRIGSPVWADFATKAVKLKVNDVEPCCSIVEVKPTPAPPVKPSSQPE